MSLNTRLLFLLIYGSIEKVIYGWNNIDNRNSLGLSFIIAGMEQY